MPLFLYPFSVGITLPALYLCLLLYRSFRLVLVLDYLYFVSAFVAAGFIDLLGSCPADKALSGQPAETNVLLDHIFALLVFPFIPAAVRFFVPFMMAFVQNSVSHYFKKAYTA